MSNLKRDNELVKKVKELNLSSADAQVVDELIRKYENATYKEYTDRHKFYQDVVYDMTNDMGFDDDGLAERMANEHCTLQQSFMRFVTKFVRLMAKDDKYTDGRNDSAVRVARKMADAVKEDAYMPMI